VSLSRTQPPCDQVGTSPQVRKPDFRPDLKFLPVATLQGGARQNDIVTRGDPIGDRGTKTLQPRLPVVVAERDSVPNLLHIRRRMKVVRIGESPTELLGQQPPDRSLSGSDDSHHNHDHRWTF